MVELKPLTPQEGIERFLRYREPSVGDSTLYNARSRLGFFSEWCDERDIDNLNSLTGRNIADFVAWRRNDIKAITLQKQLSSIRSALRWWADIEAVEPGLAEKVHAPELPDGAESRDVHLEAGCAKELLAYLKQYQYASRNHVVLALLWRTGIRRGALRSIDRDDLHPDHHAVELKHRPETNTNLKNGKDGERWVYLGPQWYQIVDDYLSNPTRHDVVDDHGREPLITTENGRPIGDTIYSWVTRQTQPCEYGECPHDRDQETCEARRSDQFSVCPSSRSPHAIRRGAITHHLNCETSPEVVSERMNVSLDVLYKHYDVRTEQEKMDVRKNNLPNE
ncbi:tyrosine-type recombinase/integrase [Halobium palmae]|uniref:Tyrosine-type recombinase/integrase n=1 Tax=Halobium palmae TaxID=1776492 RepID=A0ABD5RVI7_9EURY